MQTELREKTCLSVSFETSANIDTHSHAVLWVQRGGRKQRVETGTPLQKDMTGALTLI